uniref:Bm11750 n=1 Tax=Brugia malayi TaxID=6279 RepID=A0A1I9GAE6_BRUMA|nr:Bm11750 [Brugia malayi]
MLGAKPLLGWNSTNQILEQRRDSREGLAPSCDQKKAWAERITDAPGKGTQHS